MTILVLSIWLLKKFLVLVYEIKNILEKHIPSVSLGSILNRKFEGQGALTKLARNGNNWMGNILYFHMLGLRVFGDGNDSIFIVIT